MNKVQKSIDSAIASQLVAVLCAQPTSGVQRHSLTVSVCSVRSANFRLQRNHLSVMAVLCAPPTPGVQRQSLLSEWLFYAPHQLQVCRGNHFSVSCCSVRPTNSRCAEAIASQWVAVLCSLPTADVQRQSLLSEWLFYAPHQLQVCRGNHFSVSCCSVRPTNFRCAEAITSSLNWCWRISDRIVCITCRGNARSCGADGISSVGSVRKSTEHFSYAISLNELPSLCISSSLLMLQHSFLLRILLVPYICMIAVKWRGLYSYWEDRSF
jgi:hypothetical protein